MDPHAIASLLPGIESAGGRTLTPREIVRLDALAQLAARSGKFGPKGASSYQLFGKILGRKRDIYIVALRRHEGDECKWPRRTWFVSAGLEEDLTPVSLADDDQAAAVAQHELQDVVGDLSRPLVPKSEEEEEEEAAAEAAAEEGEERDDAPVAPPTPEVLTEAHLVAFLLEQLECGTGVVPRSAWLMCSREDGTSQPLLRPSPTWRGLKGSLARNLRFYGHLRAPECPGRIRAAARPDVCYATADVLDPLDEDAPRGGAWALRQVAHRVVLRSMMFPGYHMVCVEGSKLYGDMYVGSGRRNQELPFVL